jgi:acetyl esterase/lipase
VIDVELQSGETMTTKSEVIPFHPDLKMGFWVPKIIVSKLTLPFFRAKVKPKTSTETVEITNLQLQTRSGSRHARYYRPKGETSALPLIFWIHGGGMIGGAPEQDDLQSIKIVESTGYAVLNVSYRLAPEHPAPAAAEDVEDAYRQIVQRAGELGISTSKIVVAGGSAGGGLAALLCQELRHLRLPQPRFQVLIYPMLDDRTTLRNDKIKNLRAWYPASNLWSWRAFLNAEPGSDQVNSAHVPARQQDLRGLPATWIGVGSLDLFAAEDQEYAKRLSESDVPCELVIVDGAFHGFDVLFKEAPITIKFLETWVSAIKKSLET